MAVTLLQLLRTVVERGGRELHLAVNSPPQIQFDTGLMPLDMPPLDRGEVETLLVTGLPEGVGLQIQHSVSFAYTWWISGLSRFALTSLLDFTNVPRVTIRVLDHELRGFSELAIPEHLVLEHAGLYVVGGAARSGRTSVTAAIVDQRNREYHDSILVVSDGTHPLHMHKMSLVTLADGTPSAIELLRDGRVGMTMDVVVFDGLYDTATLAAAFALSRRGRVVLLTSFGRRANDVIRTIVSSFPSNDHEAIRREFAEYFQWVLTVSLIPRGNNVGVTPAYEALVATTQTREMIAAARYDNIEKILAQDDPYSPHRSLLTSLRDAIARRLTSKAIAERFTGLDLDL